MLSEISSYQLSEWMAFSSLEPFGFETDMYGHGIVAAAVFNSKRTKDSDKYVEPKDFIPKVKEHRQADPRSFFDSLKTMLLLRKDKR